MRHLWLLPLLAIRWLCPCVAPLGFAPVGAPSPSLHCSKPHDPLQHQGICTLCWRLHVLRFIPRAFRGRVEHPFPPFPAPSFPAPFLPPPLQPPPPLLLCPSPCPPLGSRTPCKHTHRLSSAQQPPRAPMHACPQTLHIGSARRAVKRPAPQRLRMECLKRHCNPHARPLTSGAGRS